MADVARAARHPSRRVVITGMGAITPVGHTVKDTWQALVAGRSGVGRLTIVNPEASPCRVAAELKDFDPLRFLTPKEARQMPLAGQLAVIAAGQAILDARLDLAHEDLDRLGVVVGTAGGNSLEETERLALQYIREGPQRLSPMPALRVWPNMPTYFVAQRYGLRGHNSTICTACSSGTQAIGEAAEVIRRGEAEVMITGGTESAAAESVLISLAASRVLCTSFNDEPTRASRPFDAARAGFVPAQGSAFLVLESLEHAQARKAPLYAEVAGCGVSNDAYHVIAPDPSGAGAALALRRALESAQVAIEMVDYINAHATSTPSGDLAETRTIKMVFRERAYDVPISSTKSMVGHMLGAAGALEAVVCVMTIREGIIHPTINYEVADPDCDLDYVPNVARAARVDVAVSNSFGIGGQNACLVVRRVVDGQSAPTGPPDAA